MKGFKQTEIGWIPEDWILISFEDAFDFHSTASYSRAKLSEDGEIGYVHYGDIHVKCLHFLDLEKITLPTIESHLLKNYTLLRDGDVIVVDASEDYEGVGKLVEVRNIKNKKVISGLHTFLLRGKEGKIADGFKGYLHSNKLVKKQMDTLATGLKVYGVSKNNLKKIVIPLPPTKAEQTAIATVLSDADALIEKLEQLIAKKRLIKQGAMQELLKPKEGWIEKEFSTIFRKINGKGFQLQTNQYQSSGSFPIIDQGQEKIAGFTDNENKVFKCPDKGIIVFGDHTRILKFIDFDFAIGADGTQILEVKNEYSSKFIFYYLLLNEVPNTGYNRHFKFLLEMNFIIPKSKSEQTRIAQILSDMDAIVTSYVPTHQDIKSEETGEGETEKIEQFEIYRKMLSEYFNEPADEALKKVEQFETEVKKKFVEEPAQMKLLIVVNKLLTGFDAPSATYLYIDKKLRDHGLFQAICRVNRIDGEDKDYGYIIDYMDLFKSLEQAFNDYTSEAFSGYEKKDIDGLLKNRLKAGKERLDEALEAIKALVEPVEPPKGTIEHIRYFCGTNTENPDELKETEPRRVALYKLTIELIRAYANIADEMIEAGYTEKEIEEIKTEIKHFENVRKEIQLASGDYIDLKQYEPAMRHLIDSYIGAEESRILANFDDMSLVELLVKEQQATYQILPESISSNREAMAEVIENNIRKLIIEENPTNPAYYQKMSVLLDELIKKRKEETLEYEQYLNKIIALSAKIKKPDTTTDYPASINTAAKRALFDNLGQNETLAIELDHKILTTKKDGWRDNILKSKAVRNSIKEVLNAYGIEDDNEIHRIFDIVKNQRDY